MKHFKPILYVLLVFSLLDSACSFEKRLYTRGYHKTHITHNRIVNDHSTLYNKTGIYKSVHGRITTPEKKLTASVNKSTITDFQTIKPVKNLSKTAKIPVHFSDLLFLDEECDVIVFKTGDEAKAKIFEITPNEIKYKPCDFLDGPMRTVRKSDVFMLKYANGTKEVFSTNNPTPSSNAPSQSSTNPSNKNSSDQSPLNKKIQPLAILSFLFSIVGLFIAGIPFGLAAVIFGAVSLKKIGLAPDRFKGKGFAIAAIAIGILDIIGAAIAISMI